MIRPLLETELETDSDFAAPSEATSAEAAPSEVAPASFAMSRRTALAAGALVAVAIALPTLPARADFAYGDLKTLRFLEEIAHLEADFFLKVSMAASAEALPESERNALNLMAREDDEMARWFSVARDKYGISAFDGPSTFNQASSRPIPSYHFPLLSFESRDAILKRALEIKGLAVGSFHNAVGAAKDPKLVEAFAALGGVQGRHLAMLSELAGQSPFVPFEATASVNEVARKFAPYGFNMEVAG